MSEESQTTQPEKFWINQSQVWQVCTLAAYQAMLDARIFGDEIQKPNIEVTFLTDNSQINADNNFYMHRSPIYDWEESLVGHTINFDANILVTTEMLDFFPSFRSLECYFYRHFTYKEPSFTSKVMPNVAKVASASTGIGILGLCINYCIRGDLTPLQALSLITGIAVPAIFAYSEYKNSKPVDPLQQRFTQDEIIDSIKAEARYLKTTPNIRNHVRAKKLLESLDLYRPEKTFDPDGVDVYKKDTNIRRTAR